MKTQLGCVVVLVAALLACKNSKKDDPDVQAAKGPPISIQASALKAEYEANEARADSKFKGKPLLITGVVDSIDSGVGDVPSVRLSTGNMFQAISIDDVPKKVAVDLNKGDVVTFLCTGAGEVMGGPMVDDCVFKSKSAEQ